MSGSIEGRRLSFAIILSSAVLAALIRYTLRDFETGDFQRHVGPWLSFIHENGKLWSLQHAFSNYNMPYLYLLVLTAYLPFEVPPLYLIKTLSVVFDFALAVLAYKIVRLKYETGPAPALAFAAVLLCPTVLTNSAMWGQSDALYASAVLACLFFLCIDRKATACIFFGIAVSFKLQSLFLAPFLFILFVRGHLNWHHLALVPATYLALLVPAWAIGRPIGELLLIYVDQAHRYDQLTLNAPNLYQWIPNDLYAYVVPLGFALTTLLALGWAFAAYRHKIEISTETLVSMALFSLVFAPYFLPKMHERYFFTADVVAIIFAFYFPKYWFVPVVIVACSLASYAPYLLGWHWVPLPALALVMLGAVIIVWRSLMKQFTSQGDRANAA